MPSTASTLTESALRHDRLWILAGLTIICLLSWYYLLTGAGTGMSTLAMTTWEFPPPARGTGAGGTWSLQYTLVMLVMWWVMMVAMMIPSATPVILLYARVYRHNHGVSSAAPTLAFLVGYLLAWLAFSVIATLLQWCLERLGLVHGMLMWSTSRTLSAALLIGAGLYQLSSLKQACLAHCRSPAAFLSAHWRRGTGGALNMGMRHGLFCVGCCWVLMALLFVGGTMNLVWIAGLTVMVLLEKILPGGRLLTTFTGLALLATGVTLLF